MDIKQMVYAAVLLSALSLFMSTVTFFEITGVDETTVKELKDVRKKTREDVMEANQEIREDIALTQARIRLMALRAEVAAEGSYDETVDEVESIRRSLNRAYANAAEESYEAYLEVDSDLETLENQLREGSAESVNSLENSIGTIEGHIEPNEMQECIEAGGAWVQFPNACADSCAYERNEGIMCAQVITDGCECGENMCWNGYTCTPN
ncbi:MAG: hypothetical protein GF416_07100 [Candidatus Altiarchaeales archaeon]|nr:hypothetical protein [Candidatus Altiarchaeales archaeon]MBD3416879.1 hypothetical protein [Candidatus Altiarchaeales archaeon]